MKKLLLASLFCIGLAAQAVAAPLVALWVDTPASTLTLPSSTTAYVAGQLIANNSSAGSVVVPSLSIANPNGSVKIQRLRLTTNDSTSTAWGSQTIQVDLWSVAPTFTNGDRGTFAVATKSANHLAAFTCVMSAEAGDGAWAECYANFGNYASMKFSPASLIYWTLQAVTGSGVTGASKVFSLTAEMED